jgi:hypothetical protein
MKKEWKHVADVSKKDADLLRKYGGNYQENELIYVNMGINTNIVFCYNSYFNK